jgi:type IV secretory pathway VirB4 component
MIDFKHTASEYIAAGAMNESIALHSFLDGEAFLTKNGQVGLVLAFPGIDFEGQDPLYLDSIARRFEAAARTFTEKHRTYQYMLKTSAPAIEHGVYPNEVVNQAMTSRVAHFQRKADSLYTLEIYLVITMQACGRGTGDIQTRKARAAELQGLRVSHGLGFDLSERFGFHFESPFRIHLLRALRAIR